MGFLDDVQSSFNRGVAGANRTASTVKLKARIADISRRRQNLAAQLGASLYEVTRNDPVLRAGRESLYDEIAALDAEREGCQLEVRRIEEEAKVAQLETYRIVCPFCGSQMSASDLFCSGCGRPISEVQDALASQKQGTGVPVPPEGVISGQSACPACGSPVDKGDSFCMHCGASLTALEADESSELVSVAFAGTDKGSVADSQFFAGEDDGLNLPASTEADTSYEAKVTAPDEKPDTSLGVSDLPDDSNANLSSVSGSEEEQMVCPVCGAKQGADDLFCGNCGYRFAS